MKALILAAMLVVHSQAFAQDRQAWLTGSELLRQRQQPKNLNWTGVAIRNGLADLSKAHQVAILLDRRIDPERPIELAANRVNLDGLLLEIADEADAAVVWLGPLAYVGPREAALRLRTLATLRAADVRNLPRDKRTAVLREASWRWEELAEPRKLVADLAAGANVEVEALDLIPHDLWPAADLPRLRWTDRLTLVANEFDLTFQFSGDSRVRLTPIVGPVVIERSYPAGKQASELAVRWKRLAPDAEIAISGGMLVVRARLEDHERLRPAKTAPAAATKPGIEVYTLTVREQPLAAVLDTLRESSINVTVDKAALEKAALSLDRRVSFKVERATLEELLEAALTPAGLTFRKEGSAYKIVPAESPDRSEPKH